VPPSLAFPSTPSRIEEIAFAVGHIFDLLTALKADYYAAWDGEKQRCAAS
jgi:hypothetical protein